MPTAMTTAQAGRLAYRVRKLHRRGDLTHADLAVADALLWSARKPGSAVAVVSYSALRRLAHVARGTVAAALRRLAALGVLTKIKRRVRVLWGRVNASRQDVSAYVLQVEHTESNDRPVIQTVKILSLPAGPPGCDLLDRGLQKKKEADNGRKAELAEFMQQAAGMPDLLAARRRANEARLLRG